MRRFTSEAAEVSIDDAEELASLLKGVGWFAFLEKQSDDEACEHVKIQLERCHVDDSHSIYMSLSPTAGKSSATYQFIGCRICSCAGPRDGYPSCSFATARGDRAPAANCSEPSRRKPKRGVVSGCH